MSLLLILQGRRFGDEKAGATRQPGVVGRAVPCPPSPANKRDLVHEAGAQRTALPTLSVATKAALESWQAAKLDLFAALGRAKNGKRLLALPDLREDVVFCAQRDVFPLVAAMSPDGSLRRI